MNGAENQMPRFRRDQRRSDGFQIAHLADHDDIGVLPERGFKRVGERMAVQTYLALFDDAELAGIHEFHRVFNGDDVRSPFVVDHVDDGSDDGGFSRRGGTGQKHQPLFQLGEFVNGRVEIQELGRRDGA